MPREYIVPGVRELIPPHGLVTVQLTNPETGKVRQEVKAENMIMNSWLAQMNVHGRGALDNDNNRNQYQPNFSPVSANSDAGFLREYMWSHIGRPGVFPGLYNTYMPWLWASDKNIAPNANRTVAPCTSIATGNMTGHARLDLAHASVAGQLNRGTVIASESWHKWDQSRVSVEFASTEGNGTYRSIGVGRLASHYDENRCINAAICCDQTVTLRDNDSQNISAGADMLNLGTVFLRSGAFEDSNHFWLTNSSNNLYVFDFETRTLTTGPSGGSVAGTNQIGICVQGGYIWLVRDKQLFKCSKYTGGSLSVLNTYNLATPLGAEIFWDITSDGTNLYGLTATKVFVMNPADGTVSSSWLHNLTHSDTGACNNIEWDPANQHLWVFFGTDDDPGFMGSVNELNWWWSGNDYAYQTTRLDNQRAFSFSTTGTALPYTFITLVVGYQHRIYGFTGMDPNGWVALMPRYYNGANPYPQALIHTGGMLGSHALLPSDVVKTAADGLKIRYDFDFA